MKGLTVRQPHASLIAAGAKPIETRSWATKYRGPLIIHAGKTWTPPKLGESEIGDWQVLDGESEGWWLCHDTIRPSREIVLGAVVASCVLADVVPIHTIAGPCNEPTCIVDNEGLYLYRSAPDGGISPEPLSIEDQRPFGDFTPGRFAWLLEDVKPTTERCPWCWGTPGLSNYVPNTRPAPTAPLARFVANLDCPVCADPAINGRGRGFCPPIPATGAQGLWEWTPELVGRELDARTWDEMPA